MITHFALDQPGESSPPRKLGRNEAPGRIRRQRHDQVPDDRVEKIVRRVREQGMGFIALHSSHFARPNLKLMGADCSWKDYLGDSLTLRIRPKDLTHPIAQGVSEFAIDHDDFGLDGIQSRFVVAE